LKEAVFTIKGVSCRDLTALLEGVWVVEEGLFLRTANDFFPVRLELRFTPLSGSCRVVHVKMKSPGRRFWGETFTVCCREEGRVLLRISRRRGVGRLGADSLGYRLLEALRSKLEFCIEEVRVF